MKREYKAFAKAFERYLKALDPNDSREWWDEQLLAGVPKGDLTELIEEWAWSRPLPDRARILQLFALEGHVEIARFLNELDGCDDKFARELAADARKFLEEFLLS